MASRALLPEPTLDPLDHSGESSADDSVAAAMAEHEPLVESLDDGPALNTDALTEAGMVMGTLPYMAPEQHAGGQMDARTDQYAFCVALWTALCGSRPFSGKGKRLVAAKLAGPPAWPRDSSVPRRLADAVRRGLAAEPGQRWPDLEPLLRQLEVVQGRASRPLALGAAGLLLLGGGTAAGWIGGGTDAPCEAGDDEYAEVWNEEARETVVARLGGLDKAYAAPTSVRVGTALDEHADAWLAGYRDACEATHVREAQSADLLDRRMACLQRNRAAVRTTVEVLGEADEALLARAVDLVSGLPDPQQCSNAEALVAALPPPRDPTTAVAVDALREDIEAAHTLRRAGRYEVAQARVDALLSAAEATDYPPVQAEALLARGRLLAELDDQDGAASDLEAATVLATEIGHAEVAAWSAAALSFIVGVRQNKGDEGVAWGKIGVAQARRYGRGSPAEAFAEQMLGAILLRVSQHDAAEEHMLAALEIREQLDGEGSLALAPILNNLGNLRVTVADDLRAAAREKLDASKQE